MVLKEYIAGNGAVLYYRGKPDMELLDNLAAGPGDLWHSSLDQGYKDAFPELVYQTAVFWWFLNDFKGQERTINWRINPKAFVIRKEVWELFKGFPTDYQSEFMGAFDFGYRLLRHGGGVPLYVKGLFPSEENIIKPSPFDRYTFFLKNFKKEHTYYMLWREAKKNPLREWKGYSAAKSANPSKNNFPVVPVRKLKDIQGKPSVSVIIPTMYRQDYTLQLLEDYRCQSYAVKEVIVIDATPATERKDHFYKGKKFPYNLIVRWQESKGSCKARNEAINLCTGDYIIFGDDDTRIPSDFVENHLRFLQTYNVEACNGLDIHANHHTENLKDLENYVEKLGGKRWKAGATHNFSNANSCVKKDWVSKLIGNDINFDGGYGEDSDFGFRILNAGGIVLFNPFSVNLHLKPPAGGYRHWSIQASVLGKKRKKQAWELEHPVKFIKPVPSPTIVYGIVKHFTPQQVLEYRSKYFFLYLFKKSKKNLLLRLFKLPYRYLQFDRSLFYAKNLISRGEKF